MKNTILIAFILLLLAACKREADVADPYRQFTGTWEAAQFIGYPGNVNLPPGNGRILVLDDNAMMENRRNDTVLYRGRYYLQHRADCHPRANTLYFTTGDSNYLWESYIELTNDQLILSASNCLADGGTTIFRRVK